jgi:hypothetical protein
MHCSETEFPRILALSTDGVVSDTHTDIERLGLSCRDRWSARVRGWFRRNEFEGAWDGRSPERWDIRYRGRDSRGTSSTALGTTTSVTPAAMEDPCPVFTKDLNDTDQLCVFSHCVNGTCQ